MKKTDIETLPFAPRDWLSAVKDIFGDSYILKLFKIDMRTYHKWIAKAPYVSDESVRGNYIEKHDIILQRLMSDGYDEIAQAIVAHHANLVGCDLVRVRRTVVPDRDNVEDEMLDDYPALTEFHRAIRKGADIDTIIALKNSVIDELDETLELIVKK